MKTVSLILRSAMAVCFAFVMSSASCDLFDKVDDITLDDVELEHIFHVDETNVSPTSVTYSLKEELDAADVNSDFETYKDKIKSITVNSVTYEVMDYTGNQVVFKDGNIGFSASSASSASSVASLGVEDLEDAEGDVKNLNYNQTALNEIGTLLKDDKKVNMYLMGTFSKTPVKFDVKVKVKVSITADAL